MDSVGDASSGWCRSETGLKSPSHIVFVANSESSSTGAVGRHLRSRPSRSRVRFDTRSRSSGRRGTISPLRRRSFGEASGESCPIRTDSNVSSWTASMRRSSGRSLGGRPSSRRSRMIVVGWAFAVPVDSILPGNAIATSCRRRTAIPSRPGRMRDAAAARVAPTSGRRFPAISISSCSRASARLRSSEVRGWRTRSAKASLMAAAVASCNASGPASGEVPTPTVRPFSLRTTTARSDSGIEIRASGRSRSGGPPSFSQERTSNQAAVVSASGGAALSRAPCTGPTTSSRSPIRTRGTGIRQPNLGHRCRAVRSVRADDGIDAASVAGRA